MAAKDTLSAAYKNLPPSPSEIRRQEGIASTFRPDPVMEALLLLKQADPPSFAKLGPGQRVALGYYSGAKAAAEQAVSTSNAEEN